MYEPKSPDEYNFKQIDSQNPISDSDSLVEKSQAENLSVKNVVLHQKQIQRLFFWLIGIGLGVGLILATIVVFALKKFGLATKPYERENQPRQEQVEDNDYLENIEGIEKQ